MRLLLKVGDKLMSDLYIPTSSNWETEKNKILKEARDTAWKGLPKTASVYMKDQDPYPSPYLNLSDYQIPRNMRDVFKWCRYFYKFDSLIGGAVNALARFPVTDIILEDMENLPKGWDPKKDSPTLSMYQQTFKDLKLADELLKIGIDYWLYGNCFIFGEFEDKSLEPETGTDLRWSRMFRLDPSKVTIDLDPLTQEKTYKWEVPPKIKRIVREKKPLDKFNSIPDIIKQAVKENKAVVLNSNNVYHFAREGESGDGSVWGTPLILNVMKQLAYRNLLRQAQEAIAREHIVPFRVYYLEPTERMDPMANWNNVASSFGSQLEQAAKDPNYKVVSPVPVNVLNLGGQGRALMLTPEIDQLQSEILAGMGVPREFIFGGVSYSAASISLRTLENQFITYRSLIIDFINNFVIKRMAEVRGEWFSEDDNIFLINAKLADLKMQDDIQQKQMVINLNAANKASDEYMYNMMGIDPDKMKTQLEIEIFERMERERRMQMYQLETNFMVQQYQLQSNLQLQAYQAQLMKHMGMDPEAAARQEQEEQEKEKAQGSNKVVVEVKGATAKKEPAKKKSDKTQDKKPQKKAFLVDSSFEKVAGLNYSDTYLEFLASKIASLSEESQKDVIQKLSLPMKEALMTKMATSNPNTVGNSASRNIKLGNMPEIEKMEAIKQESENMVQEHSEYTTSVAMLPVPEKLPQRRNMPI